MTAVPAARGAGVHLLCDGCGAVAEVDSCGLHDTYVGHVAVTMIGWTGSTFARGPHHCPACLAPERGMPARGPRTSKATLAVIDGVAVVHISGTFDASTAALLQTLVRGAVVARRTVIADLSGVTETGAAAAGALVRARNAVLRDGGELLLAAPPRPLHARLRLMRLRPAFRTFGSVRHAITVTQARAGSLISAAAPPG